MFYKLIATTAVFALGYYLGREVGRTEPIRRELEEVRKQRADEALDDGEGLDQAVDDDGY